jgi:transposase InsO family protein
MNVHQNARLTPAGRALMIRRIQDEGWRAAEAAEASGVSERTAYKWLRRYRAGEGVNDRSSAPHASPHRLPAERLVEIERLRRQRCTGPQIAFALAMARSSVGLVLRRLGLGRLALLDPKPPVTRYERKRPGEMIHLDIKKLGKINGIGHRFAPRGRGMHANKGSGYDYLHVAIDDASRTAYTEILPTEGQDDTTAFLKRALGWYARLNVVVERVMTDNGSAYRSKMFAAAMHQAGARHVRTRPYTPRTNGKAERFIQTSLREWAYARPYASSQQRREAIHPWITAYNLNRPHSGIGGIPPWQRLNNLLGNDT